MPSAIRVGMVGAGLAAGIHLNAYRRVSRVQVEVAGIASRTHSRASALADRHGVPHVYPSVDALLADPEIDVVDLCVPVHLHYPMLLASLEAGKHVVCEKPLIGFAGEGRTGAVPRREMYSVVERELAAVESAAHRSGRKLLYAENWVYAPAFRRMAELAMASGGSILEIRGHEAHSGSTSEFSKRWETSGGGALLRLGIHPLSAAIYLKQLEGIIKDGKPRRVSEVWAQTADLTRVPGFEQARHRSRLGLGGRGELGPRRPHV